LKKKIGFLDAFHSTICNFPFNGLLPEMRKISGDIPVLLLWGDNDKMCQGCDLFMEAVPHAKLAIMQNCGHSFIHEDLDQAQDHIGLFLDTL